MKQFFRKHHTRNGRVAANHLHVAREQAMQAVQGAAAIGPLLRDVGFHAGGHQIQDGVEHAILVRVMPIKT